MQYFLNEGIHEIYNGLKLKDVSDLPLNFVLQLYDTFYLNP